MVIRFAGLACWALPWVCVPSAGYGQTAAEEAYLRARREAERTTNAPRKAGDSGELRFRAHQSALADLERRLRPIIGAVNVRGFSDSGHINIETLFKEMGFGKLDGLRFESADHRTEMLVTTRAIMSGWLSDHGYKPPRPVEDALHNMDVHNNALVDDAAVSKYADLKIPDASRQGIVSAMLVLTSQDPGQSPPEEVLVSVARGSRIFILRSQTVVPIDSLPVCLNRAHAAYKRHAPGDHDASFRSCYAEHLSSISGLDRVIRQVTALVAALPPR